MKHKFSKYLFLFFVIYLFFIFNCKKEEIKRIIKVTTDNVSQITTKSATLNGTIVDIGEGITEHGFCWSTTNNPTIELTTKTQLGSKNSKGSFTSSLTGLSPGINYYIRSYASDSETVKYGNEINFTTSAVRPTVNTTSVTDITYNSATCGGNVTDDGGASITSRGVCWSTSQNPMVSDSYTSDGSGTGSFSSSITGLSPVTTYYVRAYATNSVGTAYGDEVSFTTTATVPTVTTISASSITESSAESGGNITDDGSATVTARGVCWSTSQNPTISNSYTSDGSGIGSFSSSITGLSPGTIYYVRAYATNSVGTAYGNEIEIMTIWENSTISDFDGNVYQTVQIGNQIWMKENLKTTKYNDGTAIPLVTDPTTWSNLTNPGYCWYNNYEASYKNTYGALYNWYTVNTGKLCPPGWHVSTDAEWKELEMFLGMSQAEADGGGWRGTDEGGKLKETGTTHWNSPNTEATNESGFTALPGGNRNYDGVFRYIGDYGTWWSSTEGAGSAVNGYFRNMYYNSSNVYRDYRAPSYGFSVRCVRD